ncbi:MAG: hypothetical protein AAFV53_00090 [Myxococcota bacterium]
MHRLKYGLIGVLLAIAAMMLWQQLRYQHLRRTVVQDHQPLLHGEVLHVLTFLTVSPDQDLIEAMRVLKNAAEQDRPGTLIYAGKIVANVISSPQVVRAFREDVPWDGVILQQFPDREAYEAYLSNEQVQDALAQFPVRFAHGMDRSAMASALMPQLLLARKLKRIATSAPSLLPLKTDETRQEMATAAFPPDVEQLGEDAIVVVNLIREGDAEQRTNNRHYSRSMMDLMADLNYGPMHIGGSIPIDHPLAYSSVAIVYYPGARFFRDLITSTYLQGIIGNKQLADTQVSVTVPITDVL